MKKNVYVNRSFCNSTKVNLEPDRSFSNYFQLKIFFSWTSAAGLPSAQLKGFSLVKNFTIYYTTYFSFCQHLFSTLSLKKMLNKDQLKCCNKGIFLIS